MTISTGGAIEAETPTNIKTKHRSQEGRLKDFALQFLVVGAFIGFWQYCSSTGLVDFFFISSPIAIGKKLAEWFLSGSIYEHLLVTVREALIGWILGSLAGILCGFVLGRVKPLERVFLPLLHLSNTLPRIALAPLFIVWFGIGEASKSALVFTIVFFIMIFNTHTGIVTINRNYLLTAKLLGKGEIETFIRVILPWCVPWIMGGLRLGLAWSLSGAVVGEFMAARAGLGYIIFNAASTLDNTSVLAGCIVLLGIAMVFFYGIGLFEKRLMRWQE